MKTKFRELGCWCKCNGYYRRIYDGAHIDIEKDESGRKTFWLRDPTRNYEYIESSCEGDCELHKNNYVYVEKSFVGVIVGTKRIPVDEYLGVDTDYDCFGCERRRIFKSYNKIVDCYIVYFANGRKRLVPMEEAVLSEAERI